MAHLLGNAFCIESLSRDVVDIQGILHEVISRVGPVTVPSWKYPDKMGLDVDVAEMMQTTDDDDEEDRQVRHVILLELVIDRLLFVIQCMSKYAEQMSQLSRAPSGVAGQNNTSVGLVVKRYWSQMTHLYNLLRQLNTETKNSRRKIGELNEEMAVISDRLELSRLDDNSAATASSVLLIPPNNTDLAALSRASRAEISSDVYQKSTQTYQTAFVPCEGCHRVQRHLVEVSEVLIGICQSQDLPSSLSKHRTLVSKLDWLSANDIGRWIGEQNKDLSRIGKHLEQLLSAIDPLKAGLASAQLTCQQLQTKLSQSNQNLKLEQDTQSAQMKMYENKIQAIQSDKTEAVASVKRYNQELLSRQKELQTQLQAMSTELTNHRQSLMQLEEIKSHLEQHRETSAAAQHRVEELQQSQRDLETQIQTADTQLRQADVKLKKEQAKYRSVLTHSESLQSKQESLLLRINDMDDENEAMKSRVEILEEENEELQSAKDVAEEARRDMAQKYAAEKALVEQVKQEKKRLEVKVTEMERGIAALQSELRQTEEKIQLLTEYPDLNGPVNPDYTGSGDIAADMSKQVEANSVRIRILEDQNAKLRNTITTMLSQRSPNNLTKLQDVTPVPLWSMDAGHQASVNSNTDKASQDTRPPTIYNIREKNTNVERHDEVFVVSRANQQPDRGRGSRPLSGKTRSSHTSSVNMYSQLKKSGLIKHPEHKKGSSRPSSGIERQAGASSGTERQAGASIMHMCSACDKMYPTAKDLEIHTSYCYGT